MKQKKTGLSFMEAVEAMKKGEKVRREDWDYNMSMYFVNKEIYFNPNAQGKNLMVEEIEADDWEIVEEKKTLSDKIILRSIPAIETLTGEEVKEALKEFIQWIHERLPSHDHHRGLFNTDDLDKKAKEIFGEKLVGD